MALCAVLIGLHIVISLHKTESDEPHGIFQGPPQTPRSASLLMGLYYQVCGNNAAEGYSRNDNKPFDGANNPGVSSRSTHGFVNVSDHTLKTSITEDIAAVIQREAELFWGRDLANSLRLIWESENTSWMKGTARGTDGDTQVKMAFENLWSVMDPSKSIWAPMKVEQSIRNSPQESGGLAVCQQCYSSSVRPSALQMPVAGTTGKTVEKQRELQVVGNSRACAAQIEETDGARAVPLSGAVLWSLEGVGAATFRWSQISPENCYYQAPLSNSESYSAQPPNIAYHFQNPQEFSSMGFPMHSGKEKKQHMVTGQLESMAAEESRVTQLDEAFEAVDDSFTTARMWVKLNTKEIGQFDSLPCSADATIHAQSSRRG
ncbi:hypothetical protein Tcan_05860 [Toxocara canis]|uniref:Uncharacterized protein n=1 Tax=Toxocara canis TaxID=6265 RepID=A0A0B2VB28_TOXCA|nr:hypothetical protein Tcan_05860 [Toxocara canis]